ncbi:uncharacterized protein LOC106870725 isoform X2 [Octopus bimaculoides]|uniref:Uncharacterized protein n=1 Tax=Octopus bimaculoides TaxID=37653 RepID=A0A0L8HGX8_OCTBM|nr:uncharacterized protein LOC106870725 isoform X2 [Octopus bimaculoides]|eukprot:XP_014772382.1 PREDICTED: uncharacterized protein LOC106870725 isoform X2 [Octopus bimaculoides]
MIKVKLHTTCVNNHLPLCRLLHHLQTHQHQRFSGGKFLRLLWLPLEIAKCKNSHTIAAKIPLEENASKKLDILPLKMILFVERYLKDAPTQPDRRKRCIRRKSLRILGVEYSARVIALKYNSQAYKLCVPCYTQLICLRDTGKRG